MKSTIKILLIALCVVAMSGVAWGQTVTSTGTGGNWSATGTWVGGVVPVSGDNVIIADGATVTINTTVPASGSLTSLTIGQGTSGTLIFDATARTITISGDVTVAAGGTFITQSATSATHSMTIGGDLTNSGTFDMSRGGTTFVCNVTFNKNGNQTVSGAGGTTRFFLIVVDLGTSNSNTLEISSTNFAANDTLLGRISGTAGLRNGTLKLSGSYAFSGKFFSPAGYTIASTAGIWINNSNVTVSAQNGTPTLNGLLKISAGTYNVGTSSGNSLEYGSGATFTIEGGSLNVAGRFSGTGTTQTITFSMSGGTITVTTQGNGAARGDFDIPASGSSFTMSAGTIAIQKASTAGTPLDYRNVAGTTSITGGTVQFGNASTSGAPTFNVGVSSGATSKLPNMTVNGTGTPTVKLITAITITGNISIASGGTLDANGLNISVSGNWSNSGTFTSGTQTVTFNGSSAQTYTQSGSGDFSSLTLNNSSGLTLNNSLTINGTLTLTSGNITLGTKNLTLNGSVSGAAATKCIVTDGTGGVARGMPAGPENLFQFPIGPTTTTYNPLTLVLKSGDPVDTFTVRVEQNITSGVGTTDTTLCVNRTWDVSEKTASGNHALLKFQWKTDEDGSNVGSILLTSAYHFNSGNGRYELVENAAGTGSGTSGDPYIGRMLDTTATSFSPYIVGASGGLPIQLSSFTGTLINNNHVKLDWTTASEINNYGFYVQKKRQGESEWSEFPNSFIPGHGTTNVPQRYTFTDNSVVAVTTQYRLKQVDLDGTIHYTEPIQVDVLTAVKEVAPIQFALLQNYPNPFNPSTEIKFSVDVTSKTTLAVYNLLGQRVATLFDDVAEAGQFYRVKLDASSFSSGMYFYKLENGKKNELKKLMLLK